MSNASSEVFDSKILRSLVLVVGLSGLTWALSSWIVSENSFALILAGVGFATTIIGMAILKDWRSGIYIFLVWLVFEDLIRKYAGNSTFMFFGKDVIIGMTYISMLIAKRRGQFLTFRPPFMTWIIIFFGVGVIQVFNPNSPNIFYGLLGIKMYFYYIPMIFAGYAILRTETDLYKILMLNMWIAIFVAGIGLVQSLGAKNFLNPSNGAPELYVLSHVTKTAPQSRLATLRPTSVFVSDGRFSDFLLLMFVLAFGFAAYLMIRPRPGRRIVFLAFGIVALAAVMTGVRFAFVSLIVDTVVLSLVTLWGVPEDKRINFRWGKAIRTGLIGCAVGIAITAAYFPEALESRLAYYSETLSPGSSTSELDWRSLGYPVQEFSKVFTQPNWVGGNGIGIASLGSQYVFRLTGVPRPSVGSESGYGNLIAEFGLLGPILWTAWTVSLLVATWKVVRKLKGSPFFPLGFAIFWFAFVTLGPINIYGLDYQNYLTCAYLWLTIGMVFRLPSLLAQQQTVAAISHAHASS